jgi:hypothetical protein
METERKEKERINKLDDLI